MYTYNYTRGM